MTSETLKTNNMKKIEIQQRVLQNGKPLDLDKFTWDEKTNTFSSDNDNLVLDFTRVDNCTFNTNSNCTFITGSNCTFKTGSNYTFITGNTYSLITDSNCTFNTGSNCTFKTNSNCTFIAGSNCNFIAGSNCTFNTDSNCTTLFSTFRFFMDKKTTYKTLNHKSKKGYILKKDNEDYFHYENETDEIVYIDKIVSKVLSKKNNVLKVINEGELVDSYIVKNGNIYSHGKTIKEAKASLIYKISDRDTSEYNDFTLNTLLTFEKSIILYRKITGSCESPTKVFAEANKFEGKKTIQEIIKITNGQYNNNLLVQFFNK